MYTISKICGITSIYICILFPTWRMMIPLHQVMTINEGWLDMISPSNPWCSRSAGHGYTWSVALCMCSPVSILIQRGESASQKNRSRAFLSTDTFQSLSSPPFHLWSMAETLVMLSLDIIGRGSTISLLLVTIIKSWWLEISTLHNSCFRIFAKRPPWNHHH